MATEPDQLAAPKVLCLLVILFVVIQFLASRFGCSL
jgi:hypothetical protein